MNHRLAHVALVVRDYDEAIRFYVDVLGFRLLKDIYQPEQDKRWVLVQPSGGGVSILLARATNDIQRAAIGAQSGGRVFLFLDTDDLSADLARLRKNGVRIVREPKTADYGTVAVFEDLYGNLWDLIERPGAG
ncbi:VOC family protein [Paracoccus saliphilus]|uniref:Catechol 2,3-dioxygenase n=1 Tax=Paracoccus saliphilus TaxID=405559 RepID=A0AA45W740_9RHOB|nr:VOC family protein [Paracoccus saliphilus]WCR03913.1 VOC family protein [Paracoccus saliphilus]SIT06387.1 Catechol 2,3-dioxygenase [Paracoccus saliphilus]